MKKVIVKEGVVAVYKGKYWGGNNDERGYNFGPFEIANVSDAEFCKKPTDMTYFNGYEHNDYLELKKATLVKVKKTVTIEMERI